MNPIRSLTLPSGFFEKIAVLFSDMESSYDQVAAEIGLTCKKCPDNCCDSYFFHHTYAEWSYLLHGLRKMDTDTAAGIKKRATQAVAAMRRAREMGKRPRVMCPVNSGGRCLLYANRLMICRLHGVPTMVTRGGDEDRFPGCFRCQELETGELFMDRTPFYQRLAMVEHELLSAQPHPLPRPRLTIAEMIIEG